MSSMTDNGEGDASKLAEQAVLMPSSSIPNDVPTVKGYDFNNGIDFEQMCKAYLTTGFQATNLGLAIEQIDKMLDAKFGTFELSEGADPYFYHPTCKRRKTGCTIFFGFTSNMISSGLREIFRFLVQHNLVDVIVTSAGGVEEDFIKCLAPTYLGDFNLKGSDLRKKGLNRIGNLLVPNDNYCKFEDWLIPLLNKCLEKQKNEDFSWTPSKLIHYLGEQINHEESVYYWAAKNNIPVFCPGLTDGSLGDMLYFHSYRNPGLKLDIIEDVRLLNDISVRSVKTGMLILGGGLVKHHICNANLMRNGADFSVFINSGQEFDGSDSGARPDEAVSWGKIKGDCEPVKVYTDATLVVPIIVAMTFAKRVQLFKNGQ